MNVKQSIIERKRKDIEVLESLPDDFPLSHVSIETVFCEHNTYYANMDLLHRIRKLFGNYELRSYYMSGGRLAMTYELDGGYNFTLYCTDAEHALQRVSKGKCKIVTKSSQSIESEVECQL